MLGSVLMFKMTRKMGSMRNKLTILTFFVDNIFDGKSKRCDNEQNNFWHKNNGNGKRQATVILRRKKGAKDAGVHTGTSCGKPSFVIKDIYVLL